MLGWGWGIYFSNKKFKKKSKSISQTGSGGAIIIEQQCLSICIELMTHSQYFLICSWAWVFGWIMLRVRYFIPRSLLRVLEILLSLGDIFCYLTHTPLFIFLIESCLFFLSFQNFNIWESLSLLSIFFAFDALTLFLRIMALTFL